MSKEREFFVEWVGNGFIVQPTVHVREDRELDKKRVFETHEGLNG